MPRGIPNVKTEDVEAPEVAPAAVTRREVFKAVRPDGTVVVVDRNIDTGEQTVTDK